ncbi:MAG: phosphoenolpyruvate--protein phosphotransferase [Anaerolineales bacterium]
MVSLVIVSHSRTLAQALADLARQVAPAQVSIAIAGGAGNAHQEFGSDALDIMNAIQSVYQDEGVLVLTDLGSTILSAEMAVEFLPVEQQGKIRLCAAALVEGTIAAAVQAGLGQPLDIVEQEAMQALQPKLEHLQPQAQPTHLPSPQPSAGMAQENILTVRLTNPHGLHARPAAQFVQTVLGYNAQVFVEKSNQPGRRVPGNSLNGLTSLGAVQGDELRISAQGAQSKEVLQALQKLIENQFSQAPLPTISSEPLQSRRAAPLVKSTEEGAIHGISIAPGIAIGKARLVQRQLPLPTDNPADDPEVEWHLLQGAIQRTQQALEARYRSIADRMGEAQAAIFKAHALMLDDPLLQEKARRFIFEEKLNAIQAWQRAIAETAQSLDQVADPYLKQRSGDVRDLGTQVLQELLGIEAIFVKPEQAGILIAEELSPNEIAMLDPALTLGVITRIGGETSHAAILLRGLGIPTVSGIDIPVLGIAEGDLVAMDGAAGLVWVNPSLELQQKLQEQRRIWLEHQKALTEASRLPAVTKDQHSIDVYANVGGVSEAKVAFQNGANGIGVLRTEFLFLKRQTPPTEKEQTQILKQIAQELHGQPIIVRTLDIGGDKSVPYLPMPDEANPYLGVRAVRLSFQHPSLFLPQIRAILRTAKDYPMCILLPMIATAEDIARSRQYIQQAHEELENETLPHLWPIELGIMVEIPSAALISPKLAEQVDFFSIGTNDLTQYTLAAERGNRALIEYSDALHPAILFEIARVVQAAHTYGKWAAVCGEVASDPIATPILVGLEVDELSMTPHAIPHIKSIIREMNFEDAKALAQQALNCVSAAEVRLLAKKFLQDFSITITEN